jgi:hypothetical protein
MNNPYSGSSRTKSTDLRRRKESFFEEMDENTAEDNTPSCLPIQLFRRLPNLSEFDCLRQLPLPDSCLERYVGLSLLQDVKTQFIDGFHLSVQKN